MYTHCVGRWCSGRRNEGDGSERTQGDKATRIRTQWRQAAQGEAASVQTRHRQGAPACSKKLEHLRTGSNNDYPRAVRMRKKGHTPHRDKGDVTWDAPPGLPCAAPLVESRNGTRGTKPPRPAASNYGNWSAALASFARCKPRHCTNQRLAARSSRAAHSPWARPTRWAFKALGSPTHNEDVRASTMLPSLLQHQSHAQTRVPQAAAAAMCSEGYRPEL